jgi:hypothetical protein
VFVYRQADQQVQRAGIIENVSTNFLMHAESTMIHAEQMAEAHAGIRVPVRIYANAHKSCLYTVERVK